MTTEEKLDEYCGEKNPIGKLIDPREHEKTKTQDVQVQYVEKPQVVSHLLAAVAGGLTAVIIYKAATTFLQSDTGGSTARER